MLLLLRVKGLRLRRMRYDRLAVLQLLALNGLLLMLLLLLLLLLNELRTLKYLHYLIACAHYRILLNDGLRRRWPQLMTGRHTRRRQRSRSGWARTANDDTTAESAVTAGRDQNRTATSTTPVGTRNRTGTGDGTSHKGHGLGLLLVVLLDMLLKCFFRRFRAT